ncbi:hypothetical protein VNO77_15533 [Canavalia gladiata]|uniref:Uncharacterized protein n=1 Tax=Canavalia gladiata TaxID=3824 RepID=A0AAN9LZ56_CANGL
MASPSWPIAFSSLPGLCLLWNLSEMHSSLAWILRDLCSEWANFNSDAYSAASLKVGIYVHPGMRTTRFSGCQIPSSLTMEHEEVGERICSVPSLFNIYVLVMICSGKLVKMLHRLDLSSNLLQLKNVPG